MAKPQTKTLAQPPTPAQAPNYRIGPDNIARAEALLTEAAKAADEFHECRAQARDFEARAYDAREVYLKRRDEAYALLLPMLDREVSGT